jgi:PAS domain S-box-containing protein
MKLPDTVSKVFDLVQSFKNRNKKKIEPIDYDAYMADFQRELAASERKVAEKLGTQKILQEFHSVHKQIDNLVEYLGECLVNVVDTENIQSDDAAAMNMLNILNSSTDSIIVCGVSGTIIYANALAERLLQMSVSELRGSKITELFPERHEDTCNRLTNRLADISKQLTTKSLDMSDQNGRQVTIVNKEGIEIPVSIKASTNRLNGQSVICYAINQIPVVTSIMRSEARSIEQIINSTPTKDGLILIKEGKIVGMNETLHTKLCKDIMLEQLRSMHVFYLFPKNIIKEIMKEFKNRSLNTVVAITAAKGKMNVVLDEYMLNGDYVRQVKILNLVEQDIDFAI